MRYDHATNPLKSYKNNIRETTTRNENIQAET